MTTERERFTQLAGLVANALHNRRAYHRFERQGRRLEVLLAVSAALTQAQGLRECLGAGVTSLAGGLEASWAALFEAMHGGETPPELVASYGAPDQIAVPSRASIARGIDPVVVSADSPAADPEVAAEMLAGGECARLYLPLNHRGDPVGLLVLAWRDAQPETDESELSFAQAAGGLLAATLAGPRPEGAPSD